MNLIKSEFRKIFYGKPLRIITLLGSIMTIISAWGALVSVHRSSIHSGGIPLTNKALTDELLSGTLAAYLFVAILGVSLVSGEFSNRTAVRTFLAAPKRISVIYSKIVIAVLGGISILLITTTVGLITFLLVLKSYPHAAPDSSSIFYLYLDAIIMGTVLGLLGLAISSLIRSQVWAVSVTLAIFVFIEPLIDNFWKSVGKFLPSSLMTSIMNNHLVVTGKNGGFTFDPSAYLKPLPAVGLLLLYALIAGYLAVMVTLRLDID
jgi:ABC-2 type transport system permease protein